ncbi:MAG: 2-succinyl-5-enolpyruvyl-6-hydroxy-3-cyclohexene-1-carboxylic-acid synthase [Bacteroidota bacterium]
MSSNRRGISELPYLCHSRGIERVIISPGSRNAPLILAFTALHKMECISITDERSAGYYALGMAMESGKPVGLICTSGTAMVNYAPALAEAYYMRIPLLALTADRPTEWIDQNDGQTVRQTGFFGNIIKGSFQLPVETDNDDDLWYLRRTMSEALNLATDGIQGPVHVNIPLREPLYEPLPQVKDLPPVIVPTPYKKILPQVEIEKLKNDWQKAKQRLVICGMDHQPGQSNVSLQKIADQKQAVVFSENLANRHIEGAIESPDTFIASLDKEQKKQFRPDLLVTCGGAVLSKKTKQYLRSHKPIQHWHIEENCGITDTYQSLTRVISMKPETFFAHMSETIPSGDEYVAFAANCRGTLSQKHKSFLQSTSFSDLMAYDIILDSLPGNCNLHLANSTPVRYAQLFPTKADVKYFSNRGTSGIDGCISTAAGAAMASDRLNIAIAGDLAFIYDSNAMWNASFPENLRIIVVDNAGGNIFKLIDTSPVIDPVRHFFETPNSVKIDKLCEAYGLEYYFASHEQALRENLRSFFKPNRGKGVFHIKTSGELSAGIFKQYYQYISQKK